VATGGANLSLRWKVDAATPGDVKRLTLSFVAQTLCTRTPDDEEAAEAEALAAAEAAEALEREEEERVRSWWKQKFPREFTRERESVYYLSIHCKNRTRMYHTLLHYKFRLLMTIRAKLLRTANALAGGFGLYDGADYGEGWGYRRAVSQSSSGSKRNRGVGSSSGSAGGQFDTSWEQWDPEDRARLLQASVAQLGEDDVFMDQEARRFQALVKETERRYGGADEPVNIVLTIACIVVAGFLLGWFFSDMTSGVTRTREPALRVPPGPPSRARRS
jgi:hypothetical protein